MKLFWLWCFFLSFPIKRIITFKKHLKCLKFLRLPHRKFPFIFVLISQPPHDTTPLSYNPRHNIQDSQVSQCSGKRNARAVVLQPRLMTASPTTTTATTMTTRAPCRRVLVASNFAFSLRSSWEKWDRLRARVCEIWLLDWSWVGLGWPSLLVGRIRQQNKKGTWFGSSWRLAVANQSCEREFCEGFSLWRVVSCVGCFVLVFCFVFPLVGVARLTRWDERKGGCSGLFFGGIDILDVCVSLRPFRIHQVIIKCEWGVWINMRGNVRC